MSMSDLPTAGPVAIAPAQVLGQQVLQQLRVMIITGQLAPGTHLVEAQLSAMFDVSRGPIRDALAQLTIEGLVESRRRGIFVVGLAEADMDELYSLRASLEELAIRTAVAHAAPDWSHLERTLADMDDAARHGDYPRYAQADLAFHSSLYEVAGHKRLQSVWQQYEPTFAVLLTLTTAEDVDLAPSYESHVELARSIREGDAEEALTTLREHLLGSRIRLGHAQARISHPGPKDPA
jgi:GntR family transcriptional regulator of gluconate operon